MLRPVLIVGLLVSYGASLLRADTYEYASTTGFTIADFPSGSAKQFAFPANGGPLDMTRTTSVGTGLSLTTRTVTYSAASPFDNPAWIAGTRDFFGIVDSGTGGTRTMTFTTTFANPLQTSDYLVFTDVEFGEKVYVKAYNGVSLIPFANFSFTKWNGNSTSGTSVNTTWNTEAGYSGLLMSSTPFGFSNPVVTLQASEPISSIEYTIDMGSASNSMGFNYVASVPEPSTLGLAASAGVGMLLWLRGRRRSS